MQRWVSSLFFAFISSSVFAEAPPAPANETSSLNEVCWSSLKSLPGRSDEKLLRKACESAAALSNCRSRNGAEIFHFDRPGTDTNGKKIFTMALIHGDEMASGSVARSWMERLAGMDPRNSWRILPIASPDGLQNKTRTNAAGVDLNRNFPTEDWQVEAIGRWEKKLKKDPRRYPGPGPASEPETQCYLSHLESFKPDFIISIHTPLAVLDFDGPKMKFPSFEPLPWISLGNFPGSLGRFMWRDKKVPVLTIELKPGSGGVEKLEEFDKLQDITGTVAIQAGKLIEKEAQAAPKGKKAKARDGQDVTQNAPSP